MTLDIPMRTIALVFFFSGSIGIFIFVEYAAYDRINAVHFAMLLALESITFFALLKGPANELGQSFGYPSIVIVGDFAVFFYITILFLICTFIAWAFLSNRKAPPSLKSYTRLFSFGGLICIPVLIATRLAPINSFFPSFAGVFAVGLFFVGIIALKHEKILFLLPFTTYRLNVVHKSSGLPLYEYRWADKGIEEAEHSGFMRSIYSLCYEVLANGQLKEILLHNGTVLFEETDDLLVVLFSSKSSYTLRFQLQKFTEHFALQFKDSYRKEPNNTMEFAPAINLVKLFFVT